MRNLALSLILEAAVKHLMEQLRKNPTRTRPAPPTGPKRDE
jgi:hypothetical protein